MIYDPKYWIAEVEKYITACKIKNMTPKERAKYLVGKFSKQSAYLVADEIKNETFDYCDNKFLEERMAYWDTVKEEINKF